MPMFSKSTLPLVLLAAASSFNTINAQGNSPDTPSGAIGGATANSVWYGTGSQSVIWHTRYHGCLAMAAYGNYRETCPRHFTRETLQRQYPGNRNRPFEVVGEWGPTEKYKSEGFMVRVPEMNKILMVFKGVFGWENFNATLSPLLGVGCDSRCMAHTGAIEAWEEVKAATNDMQAIKSHQGDLVWSAAGHGFGGMIMQVAALELKSRGLLFSAQSFGSPPVFNVAAANRWDHLFHSDASQRTVSNRDAVPAKIPYHNKRMPDGTLSNSSYAFVNTGIHVWGNNSIRETAMGTANMYGQNYNICLEGREDPRCGGGNNEADHYFYFTDIGTCCESGWTASYNATFDRLALASDISAYSATATEPRRSVPITSVSHHTTSTLTMTLQPSTTTASVEATSTVGSAVNPQNNAAPPASTLITSAGGIRKSASFGLGSIAILGGVVALF